MSIFFRMGRFFYNLLLADFVSEYFCLSRRILASFAKFFQESVFSEIPNASFSVRSSSPPPPTHGFLTRHNFTNPSPCSQFFLHVRGHPISTRKQYLSGANTRSVLARFYDNNWEKGKDFVKICQGEKRVGEGRERKQ